MTDDPGVLGNLPRSRPGRRSEKRDSGGAWSEAAGAGAAAGGASKAPKKQARASGKTRSAPAARGRATAGSRSGARTRSGAGSSGASAQRRQPAPAPRQDGGGDPVSGAIRAAGQLAEAGVKTAVKVAGGVISRLPRP